MSGVASMKISRTSSAMGVAPVGSGVVGPGVGVPGVGVPGARPAVALLGLGLFFIRRGDARKHRACMLLMAAATSGAMFFRVYLAAWVAWNGYAHFKLFYSCDAWAAWLTPLAGMGVWLWVKERDANETTKARATLPPSRGKVARRAG